jgi:hypothetical protein
MLGSVHTDRKFIGDTTEDQLGISVESTRSLLAVWRRRVYKTLKVPHMSWGDFTLSVFGSIIAAIICAVSRNAHAVFMNVLRTIPLVPVQRIALVKFLLSPIMLTVVLLAILMTAAPWQTSKDEEGVRLSRVFDKVAANIK